MIARALATFGGVGRFPRAPGTAASVVAAAVLLVPVSPGVYPWAVGIAAVVSFVACVIVARVLFRGAVREEDPGWFVLDEACGVWIAAWRPAGISPWSLLLATALFRLFDIWKPFPIRQLQDLPYGLGIVVDDAVAGLFALGISLCVERWLV